MRQQQKKSAETAEPHMVISGTQTSAMAPGRRLNIASETERRTYFPGVVGAVGDGAGVDGAGVAGCALEVATGFS
jgi:hypothetical protein